MNTNRFSQPDDPFEAAACLQPFVKIRVHSWLKFFFPGIYSSRPVDRKIRQA
jgi:hypothetical protein